MNVVSSVLTTAPSTEPVTETEAKARLRLETTADDALITALIVVARQKAEEYLRRALITQSWTLWLDWWPHDKQDNREWWDGVREGSITNDLAPVVCLPQSPVVSITHIKTYAADNSATTMSSDGYRLDAASSPARVCLNQGTTWPLPGRTRQGVEIEYVCGYGAASAVPRPIREGILMLITHLYENREAISEFGVSSAQLPFTIEAMWSPYRVIRL